MVSSQHLSFYTPTSHHILWKGSNRIGSSQGTYSDVATRRRHGFYTRADVDVTMRMKRKHDRIYHHAVFRIRQRDERGGRRKEVAELLFEDEGDSETTFDTLLLRIDHIID